MSHKDETLILKDKGYDDELIKFQPNWSNWEDTLENLNGAYSKSATMYIEIENETNVIGIGLTLKQMKKLRKYLNNKIKYLEGEI